MGCIQVNSKVYPNVRENILTSRSDSNKNKNIKDKKLNPQVKNGNQYKHAKGILDGLEIKIIEVDEQIDIQQELKNKETSTQLENKQLLKQKYPANNKIIKAQINPHLPKLNLQGKVHLRSAMDELIFIESTRVDIVEIGEIIHNGYCNNQQYDGFGIIFDKNTLKVGQFFESSEIFGQGLFSNEENFKLGQFKDQQLNGNGVHYIYLDGKRQKQYNGQFKNDYLDCLFPNKITNYSKMQRYIGYTLKNKFNNFGFNIDQNQISQFSYYKEGKQLMISNLRNLFQNQDYIKLFDNWREKLQNLVQFISSLQELQEESRWINKFNVLQEEFIRLQSNRRKIIYKSKRDYIESHDSQLIMRQFIDTGSFVLILQNQIIIYLKLIQQKTVECVLCEPLNLKNECQFALNSQSIRIVEGGQVYFGFYQQSKENGIFKQFSLSDIQLQIDQILNGYLKNQSIKVICQHSQYFNGQMLREDQSNMEFQECFDQNVIINFQYHYLYANIDQQFKQIIDLVIKLSSQQQIYLKNGMYYQGQWQMGKFEGIGIRFNQSFNKYRLGIFRNSQQTEQGVTITTQTEKLIIEFSQFKFDKICDLCKVQEITSNQNIIRFINKQQGGYKNERIDDNKILFNQPFGEDRKDLQKKYEEFNEILKQENIIIIREYQNQDVYNWEDGQQQYLTQNDQKQFGRSITINPFELYEGVFNNNKKQGYGQLMAFQNDFQLFLGIFNEDNLQQVLVKINLISDIIDNRKKYLNYQLTDYLYNISKINSILIEPEYKKKFTYTNQIEFQLTDEMIQILSRTKPILRMPENDLVFLKTLNINEIFHIKSHVQQQFQGEIQLNDDITGFVVIKNESYNSFSSGYIIQNKLINTFVNLQECKLFKQQDDLVYKSIQGKQRYISTIVNDTQYTMKYRKYPHKCKYLLKAQSDKNEFGAIFHENGLCQYYQQHDKVKVYQSNGQINYNYSKTKIQQDDYYQKLIEDDDFNLSLNNWTQTIQEDQENQLIPIILRPENQYYKIRSQGDGGEVFQQFWSKGKIQQTERTQKFLLIRMVNEISIDIGMTNTFEVSLNMNKQLLFKIQKQGKVQINELYYKHIEEFINLDQNQIRILLEFISKDSRLQYYFDKVLEVVQSENRYEIIQNIQYSSNKKMYLLVKKQEQRALIINDEYFYYGQYDQISPNGYGFAYYLKSNYKYKGQWVKGLKEGWGYITYFLDRDINNKELQEKQFDRFIEDQADNLPDLDNFEHIRFPLIDLNEQQIELIQTCKNIYLTNVEQLEIDIQESFFIDQQLSLKNSKDEQSFMKQSDNQNVKKFRITAFRNKLSGSIYQGNWSKQNMHGYGKIIYQSNNFYSGYFKQGQRDFRGLYLKNLTNQSELQVYIGHWKNDKQDSYYYDEIELNKPSLLANYNEIYLGEFQKDQVVGQARIYDMKLYENFQLNEPKSDIKQYFKVQVDLKNFNCDLIYQCDCNEQQQPNPPISENILKLMNDRFRLKIQRKQINQKEIQYVGNDDTLTYCPLYFEITIFDQIFYYKGQWKDFKPQGEGFALNENTYIQGTFKEGNLIYGYYICQYYQYLGEWEQSQMCGVGEFYNSMIHYKGYIKNGLFHGDGKLRFLEQNIQLISGQWENGIHKSLKSSTELSQGAAIKYTQYIDQNYVDIAHKYNFQLQKEMIGYKYVQNEDFYSGNIQNLQKYGKGTLITRENYLYSGQFENDQFIEGLIIKQNFVQIISQENNQLKMIEYNLNDEYYRYYGSCRFVQQSNSYQKENGCLINKQEKFIGQFYNNIKKQGKIVYNYGCIVEVIYDENEMISEVKNIVFQITPFIREMMNKFNIYDNYEMQTPQYSQVKFDGQDYFQILNRDLRILLNQNKVIYQQISKQSILSIREFDLENQRVYLGKVKNEKKQDVQAICFDKTLNELYIGEYEDGLREGNGRLIKQKQIMVGYFLLDQFKSGKVYNEDGSYFKITDENNKINKPFRFHLGNLEDRWQNIDQKLNFLKEELGKQQMQENYSKHLQETNQIYALEVFNTIVKDWIDCKQLIKKMNKEGCFLIQEQQRVVPFNESIPSLVILDNYSISYELMKIDNIYFGCFYQTDKFTLGYFDESLNKIDESIIFYHDGSIWFSSYSQDNNIKFIRYFKHQYDEELKHFQSQLDFIKSKEKSLLIKFKQGEDRIIYQLSDVIKNTQSQFYRLMYPEKQLSYKGTIDGDGEPNGNGEIYRENLYFFKGYRVHGNRKLGLCYERNKYLHFGEYDIAIEGSGIQITQDCQYVGSFKNNSQNGKGRKTQNGVIIEGLFEQNQIKQIHMIDFDQETFRPYILYEKVKDFTTMDIKFGQFNKEIKLSDQFNKEIKLSDQFNKEFKLYDNNIHRINQYKGDIIFQKGDYQWGNFELGILKEGLYYNKKEDKIYVGSFELGHLNTETGMSFDGKVLIKGKFDFGIMNGYSVIIWFNEKMEQLQKLVSVFQNGNPIKVSEFKPKQWQQELLDKKLIKKPYKIEVDGRFLVFKSEFPYNIYIDVFSNEILCRNDDRVLVHYEEGNIKDLEIMNYQNIFSNIIMNERNAKKYEGPGLLGMKHSEDNSNQYKYNKLWYQKKDIDQYTGEYKIFHKYVFGKLIIKNQNVDMDRDVDQYNQQKKQDKSAIEEEQYDQMIQRQMNQLIETLEEKLQKQNLQVQIQQKADLDHKGQQKIIQQFSLNQNQKQMKQDLLVDL